MTEINNQVNPQTEYRKLPAVDALLQQPSIAVLSAEYGATHVTETIRTLLDEERAAIADGNAAPPADGWATRLDERLQATSQPLLRPVINASGVIIHTNLGRAPLSKQARAAVESIGSGYSNLEYDLDAGGRGSRYDHSRDLLRALTGAEDALVVNNCASAVFLILRALCKEREVVISRSELVEIGGGFRIPDVLRQSDAILHEVGTTNRTHPRDFSAAISAQTAALMRVHSSNFRLIGFVTAPTLAELAEIRNQANNANSNVERSENDELLLIDDLGSGTLLDTRPFGLSAEPMAQESIAAGTPHGADVVAFSGDKLLGGPQAGIIVGKAAAIAKLRSHPLARALRVDKMMLAALDATLRSYQRGQALDEIPVWQMISASKDDLRKVVDSWADALHQAGINCEIVAGESTVGGGSLPGETLPTWLLALQPDLSWPDPALSRSPDRLAADLREQSPPIVARIQHDQLVFDPRTVLPEQRAEVVAAIIALFDSARSASGHQQAEAADATSQKTIAAESSPALNGPLS